MESIWVFLFREEEGTLSCFPSKEIHTPGRSLSERHKFSGSNVSNSTYSPLKIACLTLVGTCADSEDCPWETEGGMSLPALGWLRRLATKLGSVRSKCRGVCRAVTGWGGGTCGWGRDWVGCIFLSFSSTMVEIRVASMVGDGSVFEALLARTPSWIGLDRCWLLVSGKVSSGMVTVSGESTQGRKSSAAALEVDGFTVGRERFSAGSEGWETALLVRELQDGADVSTVWRRSINCSRVPVIGKLFCDSRRRRTSFVRPANSIAGDKMLREKLNELNFGKFQAEWAHMAGRMREPNKVVTWWEVTPFQDLPGICLPALTSILF